MAGLVALSMPLATRIVAHPPISRTKKRTGRPLAVLVMRTSKLGEAVLRLVPDERLAKK